MEEERERERDIYSEQKIQNNMRMYINWDRHRRVIVMDIFDDTTDKIQMDTKT